MHVAGKTPSPWESDGIHLASALLAPDPPGSPLPDDQKSVSLDGHFDSLWRPDRVRQSLYPVPESCYIAVHVLRSLHGNAPILPARRQGSL
jgi:hypothetical protein